jgi:hypothetical protein
VASSVSNMPHLPPASPRPCSHREASSIVQSSVRRRKIPSTCMSRRDADNDDDMQDHVLCR